MFKFCLIYYTNSNCCKSTKKTSCFSIFLPFNKGSINAVIKAPDAIILRVKETPAIFIA